MISQENKLKFRNILTMIIIGIGFGATYNFLFYPHNFTEFAEAIFISIIIGFMLGMVEEFLLKVFFQRISFYKVLLIRTILYSFLTCIILSFVLSIEIAYDKQLSYVNALKFYFLSPFFKRDYLFSITFIFMIILIVQVVQIIGLTNLIRLITGQYHKPREVRRIFMFIDLNDSTTIAERLGNEQYSSFVKECINDISDAIILNGGEIYQYVGDEVSVVWSLGGRIDRCLDCFFKIQLIIDGKREQYLSRYGIVPQFKAAAHLGMVLLTEVGKFKKELVYHGDVVNTTFRIIEQCRELNKEFLISEDLMAILNESGYDIAAQGEIPLRGKTQKMNLYGISQREHII